MKIALIGLGHIAEFQLQALTQSDDMVLSDAFDINSARASLLPAQTRFHSSLDRLLEQATADVFMVSTPNVTHFEIARQVIAAGKPVVVEKPICSNPAELETLINESRRRQAFVYVALHASFASDLHWWLSHRHEYMHDIGSLIGFTAGFYDPLVVDGQLREGAASLGGSWFDSGINALSVIGALEDPRTLAVEEARMTAVPQIPCQQLQGSAILSFPGEGHRRRGVIDTNWTLGLNLKVTTLLYERAEVTLHHTKETVIVTNGARKIAEVVLSTSRPRLTNHYTVLFRDLADRLQRGESNLDHAVRLHELLFSAAHFDTT